MRRGRRLLLLAALLMLARLAASAGTVFSGIWYEYYWDSDTGTASSNVPAAGCTNSPFCPISPPSDITFTDDPPWIYMASSDTLFTITDVAIAGDSFNVYDFGRLILATPTALNTTYVCGVSDTDYIDPAVCVKDPNLSHGQVILEPGLHSITITARDAPFGDGVGDFIIQSVPEPASWVLSAAAMAGLAILKLYRAGTRSQLDGPRSRAEDRQNGL